MSEEQDLRQIVREESREGTRETLQSLGLDVTDLHGLQADLQWLRRARQGSEDMGRWVKRGAVLSFIGFIFWLLKHGLFDALIRIMTHRGTDE